MKMPTGPDVLVIEDDAETVEGIISELEFRGVVTDNCASLAEAGKRLAESRYHVLLVDLLMQPDLDDAPSELVADGSGNHRAGLDLILGLRMGEFGELNQETPYYLVSAQAIQLEKIEKEFSPEQLSTITRGRVGVYQKGQMIGRFVTGLIETHFRQS